MKDKLFFAHWAEDPLIAGEQWTDFSVEGMGEIRAPAVWSPQAVSIAASRYLRRGEVKESSIEALFLRVQKAFSRANREQVYLSDSEEAELIRELRALFYHQAALFNSPVWFNFGLFEAYGLEGQSEKFYWDGEKSVPTQKAYWKPQVSACFIQSIEDSLESIFELLKSEAKIFKFGSGTGTNFSNIRGANESLSGGGKSSGLMSFLRVFDSAAGAIKSGGTTRRSAKMVCLDIDHPEIIEFIDWKLVEEEKWRVLSEKMDFQKLVADETVSGQNSNNSIRVPDKFFEALRNKEIFALRNRTDGQVFKELPAEMIWKKICHAAWACGDPGLQFSSTINDWHLCPSAGKINASNPCSEYMFLDNTSCNLASINLLSFVQGEEFDFRGLANTVTCLLVAQELLVDHAGYPTAEIAENSHRYRPLGLGFSNLGALLMRLAVPYDSDQGRLWAGKIMALIHSAALLTSAKLAERRSPFSGFDSDKGHVLKVLNRHAEAAKDLPLWNSEWDGLIESQFSEGIQRVEKSGLRNAQVTVVAPTGTISLVMDCDTSGIEPEFTLRREKTLVEGKTLHQVSSSAELAMEKLGYSEAVRSMVLKTGLTDELKAEHQKIFQTAVGPDPISPEGHIKMVAAVQPFVSGAISKTVNLPGSATEEDVSRAFLLAHELGLKAVAIYRDGSKVAQPLNASESCEC